jgi:hypothetical protein
MEQPTQQRKSTDEVLVQFFARNMPPHHQPKDFDGTEGGGVTAVGGPRLRTPDHDRTKMTANRHVAVFHCHS